MSPILIDIKTRIYRSVIHLAAWLESRLGLGANSELTPDKNGVIVESDTECHKNCNLSG